MSAAAMIGFAPSAQAILITVTGGGLSSEPTNYACSTLSPCSSNKTFDLLLPGGTGAASGTINAVGTTATIALSVPAFSFDDTPGGFGGITKVLFTSVAYSATMTGVSISGSNVTGFIPASGTVTGFYEQLNGATSIVGPTAFSETASFGSLSCTSTVCALVVGNGLAGNYDLDINGQGLNRFVNTFNMTVVPEPGTALLVMSGLLGLAHLGNRRRSR